ncbi:MAG TPA: hypothetical protein VFQ61_37275 [Polyangiaceae bacterium]|nr:hypothetical protein [Polyangiaceae bacterium]
MSNRWKTWLPFAAVCGTTLIAASGSAEGAREGAREKNAAARVEEPAAPRAEDRSAQDQEILRIANDLASEAGAVMERWLASDALKEERLLSRLYYPIRNTNPVKYNTDYDALADRDLQPLLDKHATRNAAIQYTVVTDLNGYVPTHNRQFSQPLTGNRAVDLVNNRSKRIFGDTVGFNASRNETPFLIQPYSRDTSENLFDLSVPLRIRGKHFGCVRIGYKRVAP